MITVLILWAPYSICEYAQRTTIWYPYANLDHRMEEAHSKSSHGRRNRTYRTVRVLPLSVWEQKIVPTQLFCLHSFSTRNEVEVANRMRMKGLTGETYIFNSADWPVVPPGERNTTLDGFMAQKTLELKVGSQVMLIKNLDQALVNGSIGVVVGFGQAEYEGDKEDDDEEMIQQANKRARLAPTKEELAPRVEWRLPNGSTVIKLMAREDFKVEKSQGVLSAKRVQVRRSPLCLHLSTFD